MSTQTVLTDSQSNAAAELTNVSGREVATRLLQDIGV